MRHIILINAPKVYEKLFSSEWLLAVYVEFFFLAGIADFHNFFKGRS